MFKNSFKFYLQAPVLVVAVFVMTLNGFGQSDAKKEEIAKDAVEAKAEFIKSDPKMAALFANAYGYAIFPNVGKGAVGVGGAAGNGVAWEKGVEIGTASLKQVSIGFQWGGQAYREVMDQQMEEQRLRNALRRISESTIVINFPKKLTPFCFPIIVDGLSRNNLSSEKFEDRVKRMQGQLER